MKKLLLTLAIVSACVIAISLGFHLSAQKTGLLASIMLTEVIILVLIRRWF